MKINPRKHELDTCTKFQITEVTIPGTNEEVKSKWNSISFKYNGNKILIFYE